ncbi:MAG TPA: SPFH domain-containing protein [Dyella sp.]|uniref:SPFH domain-containing protein n=1 Tax=Dyella sp. TaxID=1869338 RepID=UPI002C77384F|nr:SPFH domain-containing protein [Dyella sp.]HUB89917.1 SPFH domain-containing protein [Dyella sp.]
MTVLTFTLIVVLALAAVAVKRVPAGQVYSLYRNGKPVRLLQPGTHVVLPLVDRVGHRIDLSGRVMRFDASFAEATPVQGTVYWQVLEPERVDAVIESADQLIRSRVLQALETETDTDQQQRREVACRLKTSLNQQLRERGVMVTRVELDAAA